ncbi:MAG TPA: DUF5683 domain-containing protein [Flavobacteriaceae bacterium]|nr:DUF5683 domain-containing protein [Flavobacteriaceae bacterium]
MRNKLFITCIFFLSFTLYGFSQEDSIPNLTPEIPKETVVADSAVVKKPLDPLTPSKAAFYSAVLPGLGQAYNKKYWKIPIFVGGITAGILFYDYYNKDYKRARNAYKRRLAGFTDDEFYGRISDNGLQEAQKSLRRNKEITLLITIGIYALNIIDANVDAHLLQYNIDDNLSLSPNYQRSELDGKFNYGLSLNFNF